MVEFRVDEFTRRMSGSKDATSTSQMVIVLEPLRRRRFHGCAAIFLIEAYILAGQCDAVAVGSPIQVGTLNAERATPDCNK